VAAGYKTHKIANRKVTVQRVSNIIFAVGLCYTWLRQASTTVQTTVESAVK